MLDEDQRRELEAHLDTGCPACAADLAEADATLANLATALPPGSPSPGVRDRLMARVHRARAEEEEADEDEEEANPWAGPGAPADPPEPPDPPGRGSDPPAGDERRHRWAGVLPLTAAVAAAVAITVGLLYVPLNQQRQHIAELEQQLRHAGETVVEHESRLKQTHSLLETTGNLFDSLHASTVQLVPLTSEIENYGDTVARLLWDVDQNTCHFFVRSLRPPEEGKTYHLWLITDDGRKLRAGRFDPSEDNGTHFEFGLPDDVMGFTRVGVSYADTDVHDIDALATDLVLEGSVHR